jgi:putative membrane protein
MKTNLVRSHACSRHVGILWGAVLATAGWGAGLARAAEVTTTLAHRESSPSSWDQRAANAAGGELHLMDREFVAASLRHSRLQARLAAMGVMRAASSDVRSLAQQLETDFRSLSDSLDAIWRRTGSAADPATDGATEPPDRLLADKSGAAFDREFVRVVTQNNTRLLTAFEQAASSAKDPGVRELAAKQLPVLRAHRTTLTELNKIHD